MDDENERQMDCLIRPLRPEDIPRIEDIAVAAWTPIYEHFQQLQREAHGVVARPARLEGKRQQVHDFATSHPDCVLVTELGGAVVGFITYTLDRETRIGVIGNNAISPEHTGKGIGTRQYTKVLEVFREQGMSFAAVSTGLVDAHAPARRAYEKAGFAPVFRSVEYMRRL